VFWRLTVNPIKRYTSGAAVVALVLMAPATVTAQSGPTACSIIDAEGLKQLTGLRDVLRRGPVAADPSEVPKGVSECEYLGLSFSLTEGMTAPFFDRSRQDQVKQGTKIEPVSGVGDEAYYWWVPRPGSYRQAGIVFRMGSRRLVVMDLVSSDSIQAAKQTLLKVAKHVEPKLR
jgi:hypothetical protein